MMRSFVLRQRSSRLTELFCGSRTGKFFQEEPQLGNQYIDDPLLKSYLQKTLPKNVLTEIEDDLINFGNVVATDALAHHNNLNLYEPILQQYDAWGKRIDQIIMHPSWKSLHDMSACEGLISIPYENKYSEYSRLYQTVKLYLFSPSSGLYSCPLAMTDGAASILQMQSKEQFTSAFKRLTSNNADVFWTSGQWMTEKKGGSDVGNATETMAVPQSDGTFKLYGYKWFTSATDANMSLTLARIVDENGDMIEGSKGLTMFFLNTRNKNGSLNGIYIEKLKKKLGTRQMPTAELILDGTIAHQVSEAGRGIPSISPMLTITRIHNSISAVSSMRRLLTLSRDFSQKRFAFSRKLNKHPLHIQTLARMEVEQRAGFFLLMKVSYILGLVENNKANDKEMLLLRILTPLLKLYTGKQAVAVASEGLESFGGHGYLEDTGLPAYLRDAQVLSIWEGTTNILALDVLRCINKTKGEVLKVLFKDMKQKLYMSSNNSNELQKAKEKLSFALDILQTFVNISTTKEEVFLLNAARDFSYSLVRTYIGCLLYENAVEENNTTSTQLVYRWSCFQDLTPIANGLENGIYENPKIDSLMVFGEDVE